jgi:hypothetical protein
MSLRAERIHYFHANATAIGGYIERPFRRDIPVQSPTSLSPSGGSDDASTINFDFEKIISARMTRTRVEGHYAGAYPRTRATAIVEDLNVLGVIRVDELVAYISSTHPGKEPDVPIIDLGRTAINGLRVGNTTLRVHLDLDRLTIDKGKDFPKKPHLFDKDVWARAGKKKDFDPDRGSLQCSLVEEIEVMGGKRPDIDGNVITIPDIGRVHLAELIVSGNSYELIMMRLELGCPTVGSSSASATKVNGQGGGP